MQTTLRLDDQLYREAKAEAAREGVTLTRFLEDGIRLRLEQRAARSAVKPAFRIFKGKVSPSIPWDDLKCLADDELENHDRAKLGLGSANS